MKKQLTALFLSFVLCLGLCVPAFAAELTGTYDKDGNLTISGGGFQANEDVFITIKDKNSGELVNIGAGTAGEDGSFNWSGSAGDKKGEDLNFNASGATTGKVETSEPFEKKPEEPTPPTPTPPTKPDPKPDRPVIDYPISVPSIVAHGTVSVLCRVPHWRAR